MSIASGLCALGLTLARFVPFSTISSSLALPVNKQGNIFLFLLSSSWFLDICARFLDVMIDREIDRFSDPYFESMRLHIHHPRRNLLPRTHEQPNLR